MTWVINRSNRNQIINTSVCNKITYIGDVISFMVENEDATIFVYETDEEAKKAYNYLLEAIKRGDNLTNI